MNSWCFAINVLVVIACLLINPVAANALPNSTLMVVFQNSIDPVMVDIMFNKVTKLYNTLILQYNPGYRIFTATSTYPSLAELTKAQQQTNGISQIMGELVYSAALLTPPGIYYNTLMQIDILDKLKIVLEFGNSYWNNASPTLIIFNNNLVEPEAPWKKVDVLSFLLDFSFESINVQFYKSNPDYIADIIQNTGVETIITFVAYNELWQILKTAYNRNLLGPYHLWVNWYDKYANLSFATFPYNIIPGKLFVISFGQHPVSNSYPDPPFPINVPLQFTLWDMYNIYAKITVAAPTPANKTANIKGTYTGQLQMTTEPKTGPKNLPMVNRINFQFQIYSGLGSNYTWWGFINYTSKPSVVYVSTVDNPVPNVPTILDVTALTILRRNPVRVLCLWDPPFLYQDSQNNITTGYAYDLLVNLMWNLDLKFTLLENIGASYSNFTQYLIDGKADIAIGAISVTVSRDLIVDFLPSYMDYNYSILIQPESTTASLIKILDLFTPLDPYVWLVIIASCFIVIISLTVLHKLSPNTKKYNFYETAYICFSQLYFGGQATPPNMLSARIVFSFWWVFTSLAILFYAANYAVIIIKQDLISVINTVSDLVVQTTYKYGAINGTAVLDALQTSLGDNSVYDAIVASNSYYTSADDAIAQVSTGKAVYLNDAPINVYLQQTLCFESVANFEKGSYAFALPPGSPYKDDFVNVMIDVLANKTNNGTTISDVLAEKYFNFKNASCTSTSFVVEFINFLVTSDATNTTIRAYAGITLKSLAGAFIGMYFAAVIGVLIALLEYAYRLACKRIIEKSTRKKEEANIGRIANVTTTDSFV